MTKGTTQDYNEKLAQDYADIRDKVRGGMLPLVARIPAIEQAVSEYVLAQDEHYEELRRKAEADGGDTSKAVPIQLRDAAAIHHMADLILHEELTWSHPDKMSIVEYPVMSDSQQAERWRSQPLNGNLKYEDRRGSGRRKTFYVDDNEVPQGRNHRVPFEDNPEIEAIGEFDGLYDALEGAGLTARQRQAIELVYFGNGGEGMTQGEAAEIMGIQQKNVNKHLQYGLAKIKRRVVG